jgi:hypothetical protein
MCPNVGLVEDERETGIVAALAAHAKSDGSTPRVLILVSASSFFFSTEDRTPKIEPDLSATCFVIRLFSKLFGTLRLNFTSAARRRSSPDSASSGMRGVAELACAAAADCSCGQAPVSCTSAGKVRRSTISTSDQHSPLPWQTLHVRTCFLRALCRFRSNCEVL